jgi:hypothetical protein
MMGSALAIIYMSDLDGAACPIDKVSLFERRAKRANNFHAIDIAG